MTERMREPSNTELNDAENRLLIMPAVVAIITYQLMIAHEMGITGVLDLLMASYGVVAIAAWAFQDYWVPYGRGLERRFREWRGIDG